MHEGGRGALAEDAMTLQVYYTRTTPAREEEPYADALSVRRLHVRVRAGRRGGVEARDDAAVARRPVRRYRTDPEADPVPAPRHPRRLRRRQPPRRHAAHHRRAPAGRARHPA